MTCTHPDVVVWDDIRHGIGLAVLEICEDDLVLVVEQHVARVLLVEHIARLSRVSRLHQHPFKHLRASTAHVSASFAPPPCHGPCMVL